jgi:bacteriocin biosynthesis cyclodehydratase domain-containing protein
MSSLTASDTPAHRNQLDQAEAADGAKTRDDDRAECADGRREVGRADCADGRSEAGRADGADLVILAGRQSLSRLAQLARERVPHLAVAAGEAIGVVGPMVVPQRTACLLCMDYVRAGNDSAWPLILAQLGRRRPDPPACDAVLAAAVAAQSAAQALIAIDHNPLSSAAINGTLELVLPDWKWRRRTWAPHPACPCSGMSPDNRQ